MPAPAPQSPPPGDPSLGVPLSAYGTPTDGTQLPAGQQNVQIPGVGDLGALMAMIQQAQAQGNLHVDTQNLQMGMQGMPGQQGTPMMGMPMLDLRSDPDRRKVVFDILKKHGYDPHEGQAIQVTDPAIQAEIMQAIQQHAAGQPPPQLPGSDPSVPGSDPNATPGT
jgi:hypothetical protein